MGLSSLTPLNSRPTDFTPYTDPPRPAPGNGSLDGEITLGILGYQNDNPDVIIFQVQESAGVSSELKLSTDDSSINITDANSSSAAITDYYSVDAGFNTVSTRDWTLTFNVTLKDGTIAPYIFVKGKSDDLATTQNPDVIYGN